MKANHSLELRDLRTKRFETNLLNFDYMLTDQLHVAQETILTTDHHLIASQMTKAVSSHFI